MKRYRGTPAEDLMIANWWGRLVADHELATLFVKQYHALSAFYRYFQVPTALLYEVAGPNLALAAWVVPFLGSWLYGLYVAPELRKSKVALQWVEETLALALKERTSILGFTRRPRRAQMYAHFGCRLVGRAMALADGEDVYILQLTRQAFERRMERRQARAERLQGATA